MVLLITHQFKETFLLFSPTAENTFPLGTYSTPMPKTTVKNEWFALVTGQNKHEKNHCVV